jgi:tRNA splicing ligase
MKVARERDKLVYRRLQWTDPVLLQRVIEERFLESLHRELLPEAVWERFFVETVGEVPTKDYIVRQIIPRPRDMIYFCRASLAHAVNRGHQRIEVNDIKQAEKEYSQYAFNSLEAETSAQLERLEELLYEFVGASSIVTRKQIEEFFSGAAINPIQIEFMYDENRAEVIRILARKVAEHTENERYQINIPYHSYLEIKQTTA